MKNLKKYLFMPLVLLFIITSVGPLKAQKKEIDKSQIPQEVVKSIQADFPAWDMNLVKWYGIDLMSEEWPPMNEDIDHYVVKAEGMNYKVEAVYNKNGVLRYSKVLIKDTVLPNTILQKIASDNEYAGWKLTGDQEVIRNFKEDNKYFVVYLEKGGEKKTVRFDNMGNKVRRFSIG